MASQDSITAETPDPASRPAAPEAEAERQFREEVLPEELEYIQGRRASHGLESEERDAGTGATNDLVGLALSGGGIRSATFNLGLLQALDRFGLFRHIDYLSTVSGGGFIGSCLSALLSEDKRKSGEHGSHQAAARFPFSHGGGRAEEDTVKYLRGHSDYLAPKGVMDYLRAFALLSRGIALNLVLLLPILLIVSLLGMVFSVDELMGPARQERLASADPRPPVEETPHSIVEADELTETTLTYSDAAGLQVWDPGYGEPIDLWTDNARIVGAKIASDLIVAVDDEDAVWLFYPSAASFDLSRFTLGSASARQAPGRCKADRADGRDVYNQVVCESPDDYRSFLLEPLPEPLREDGWRAWDPRTFSLPATGKTLLWISLVFIGLYPFAAVLSGPLGRLASGLARAFRLIVALRPGRSRRRADPVTRGSGKERSRALAASWRIAVTALLGLPLFGDSARWFETLPDATQQYWWPWVGVAWMAIWWLVCVALLLPLLSRWRTRPASTLSGGHKPPSRVRLILYALLLLLPWVLLALRPQGLGTFFGPDSVVWEELPRYVGSPWLIVPLWWVSCLALLAPVLFRAGGGETELSEEQARWWNRRMTGRLYAAANLVLWIYLAVVAFSPLTRQTIEVAVQSVVAGFGTEGGTLASRLASVTLLGFLAGVQFLLWKVFARLAGRSDRESEAQAVSSRDDQGKSSSRPVAKVAGTATSILWRERYEKAFSFALVALAAVAFFEVQPYLIYHYNALKGRYSVEWLYFVAAASFLAIVLAAMFLQAIRGVGQKLVMVLLGVLGPLLPFLVYLTFVDALVYDDNWFALRWLLFGRLDPWITAAMLALFVVTIAVVAYLLGKLIDANSTGMHGFYRDRVSQGYLVGVDRDGILGPEEELSLADVCQEGSGAPYHLINASLNMQSEMSGAQRWRNGDFFTFSKLWCGGPQSEYCRTENLEYAAPHVHLGSAMAVSAAAAAPNMGSYTSPFLVMLMTLLNVRLGLWLPNPRRVRRMARLGMTGPAEGMAGRLRRWWRRLKSRPSGYYLVDEMTSRLDASGPHVNLSDGGHLENTGAYELLRRRCRFIVIGDAESDPGMRFGSLAALIRYASIDLGVSIDIDLEPLRLRSDGTSAGHWALGTIHYPAGPGRVGAETGQLLYVKASVDGTEPELIREYRARHPDFPQESTADQIFEEDQFEAYRALGFRIGSGLCGECPVSVEEWFAGLSESGESASG